MATILIVDANPADRRAYITLLGNYGHRLLEAGDGIQALAIAHSDLPDLIITDILCGGRGWIYPGASSPPRGARTGR